jgi:GrpB-like predicted nucleotidyltransferase (UPF0157 family)
VREVHIVPYDPAWAERYYEEASRLRVILEQEVVAIHHIGSTSVPDLPAKPIIDILVEVREIEKIDALDPLMRQEGYQPRGENGLPGRRYFVRGSPDLHTHHVHIYQQGDPDIPRHLHFRDYLRTHPEEAERYGKLKQALAPQFPLDIDAYQTGKAELAAELQEKAIRWAEEWEGETLSRTGGENIPE